MKKNELVEPMAKKVDKILKMHDHERNDEFYWLNNPEDPEVIDYLERENDYYEKSTKHLKNLENKLHQGKRRALEFSTSNFSGTYAKEVEAYILEDKPKKVKSMIKKYCL